MSHEKIAVLAAIAALVIIYFVTNRKKTVITGISGAPSVSAVTVLDVLNPDDKRFSYPAQALVYICVLIIGTSLVDQLLGGNGLLTGENFSIVKEWSYYIFLIGAIGIFIINWLKKVDTMPTYRKMLTWFLVLYLLVNVLALGGCNTSVPGFIKERRENNKAEAARELEEKKEAELAAKTQQVKTANFHQLKGKTLTWPLPPEGVYDVDDKIKKGQKFQFVSFDGPFEIRVKEGDKESCWKNVEDNKIKKADASGILQVKTGYKQVNLTIIIEE